MVVMTVKPIEEKPPVMVMSFTIQVFHVMVVIVMFKDNIEVTGIYPRLRDTTDTCLKTCERQTLQCLVQHIGICTQIEQGGYGHITADAGITFEI
jgi:hypothetical protein